MKKKQEETKKVFVRLSRHHPRKFMRLGRHTVTNDFTEFELNAAEVKALIDTEECKHWFEYSVDSPEVEAEKSEDNQSEDNQSEE